MPPGLQIDGMSFFAVFFSSNYAIRYKSWRKHLSSKPINHVLTNDTNLRCLRELALIHFDLEFKII